MVEKTTEKRTSLVELLAEKKPAIVSLEPSDSSGWGLSSSLVIAEACYDAGARVSNVRVEPDLYIIPACGCCDPDFDDAIITIATLLGPTAISEGVVRYNRGADRSIYKPEVDPAKIVAAYKSDDGLSKWSLQELLEEDKISLRHTYESLIKTEVHFALKPEAAADIVGILQRYVRMPREEMPDLY